MGVVAAPVEVGITPARAGKTGNSFDSRDGIRDHPRSCGKDSGNVCTDAEQMGSPPLVRERQLIWLCFLLVLRITPARAGKTGICRHRHRQYEDHPRSCGKDTVHHVVA